MSAILSLLWLKKLKGRAEQSALGLRDTNISLVIVGNYERNFGDLIWFCNLLSVGKSLVPNWKGLIGLPFKPRIPYNACCVSTGRYILITGGEAEPEISNYGLWHLKFWINIKPESIVTNACYICDLLRKRVDRIDGMKTARKMHVVVPIGDHFYAIGGVNKDNLILDTVEEYIVEMNQWRVLNHKLLKPCVAMAACSLHENFYIISGITGDNERRTLSKTVYRYNIQAKKWAKLSDLPEAVAFAGCAVFNGMVFVIGGQFSTSLDDFGVDVPKSGKTWILDPMVNLWNKGPELNEPRSRCCVLNIGKMIYCMGGYDKKGKLSRSVEVFDKNEEIWTRGGINPIAICGQRIVAVNSDYLPEVER